MMDRMKTARNMAIIVVIAAAVYFLPGGGRAASAFEAALWVAFGVGFGYLGLRFYREHRISIHSLGDRHRALLYGGLALGFFAWACARAHVADGPRRARLVRAPAFRGMRRCWRSTALADATERRFRREPARPILGWMATAEQLSDSERARRAFASSAAACPISRACTCSATAGPGDLRGQGEVGAQAGGLPLRQGTGAEQPGPRGDGGGRGAHRMRGGGLRGRGAAGRAELHQAVPAALQHPPARRQVLPVHRDLARRGLPARVLHARASPLRPRVLRSLLQRKARARDAGGAGQGLHVPLVHGPGARATQRQPVPGLLHKALRGALRGLRLAGGLPAQHRGGVDFLSGRFSAIEQDLEARMRAAAAAEEFEQATLERNRLRAVRSLLERRRVTAESVGTFDAVAVAVEGREANAQVFQVRDGVLSDRQSFYLQTRPSVRWRRWRRSSCSSTTAATCRSPRCSSYSASWARARRSRSALAAPRGPVELRAAERGEKRRILELAERNARLALDQERLRSERRRQGRVEALEGLQRALGLDVPPIRIECFDISNLGGTHTVASMVVFEGGAPKKADYRRFTIRRCGGARPDDYASMAEVLSPPLRAVGAPGGHLAPRLRLRPELRVAAERRGDRRRQGPARGGAGTAARLPRAGRGGGVAGQAHRGGVHPRSPRAARARPLHARAAVAAARPRRGAPLRDNPPPHAVATGR